MQRIDLRPLVRADVPAAVDVVVDAGMFTRGDTGPVEDLLSAFTSAEEPAALCLLAVDGSEHVVGIAYCEPRPATNRLWELTMIGVRPSAQRSGVGGRLLSALEQRLTDLGARMLVVETSATAPFVGARAFYARHGYEGVAHVDDWWEDGDGLVVYRRRFTAPSGS